jgi:pre-mRNA-processing factor SLU7
MAGIEAANASSAQNLLSSTKVPGPSSSSNEARNGSGEEFADKVEQNFSKKRVGEGSVKLDEDRLAQAINEEKKRKFQGDDDDISMGKKRKNVQQGSHDVTEEELGK